MPPFLGSESTLTPDRLLLNCIPVISVPSNLRRKSPSGTKSSIVIVWYIKCISSSPFLYFITFQVMRRFFLNRPNWGARFFCIRTALRIKQHFMIMYIKGRIIWRIMVYFKMSFIFFMKLVKLKEGILNEINK